MTILVPRQTFYGDQFRSGVQVRVNASTFQVFKTCQRKYRLVVLENCGRSEDDPDLRFGTLLHAAKAVYEINKARGMSHDEALQGGFRYLLHETWDEERGCSNFEGDSVKNRTTLLRTYVWYVDNAREDSLATVVLPSGRPAVELQFEFGSGVYVRIEGEEYEITFCGMLDRIAQLGMDGPYYIPDTKTSRSARWLNAGNFSPDGQFSLYALAGKVCFGFEVEGVVLDGVEVGVNGTKFHREVIPRGPGVLAEWLADQRVWLRRLVEAFDRDEWPQNDAVCGLYGGCGFRQRCASEPGAREGAEASDGSV